MSTSDNPADHTASPASPTFSTSSSSRASFQSHGRTLSMVAENAPVARSNRFSVQFPIQPPGVASPARAISPTREPTRASFETPGVLTGPSDGNYLHLIAAQERKVLELKEELQRAEAELNKLKIEWARHEATRKRDDAKRLTKLQTLQQTIPTNDREDDSDGSSAWMQQEMERRKALLSGSRTSHRTVFPGQRHARALSLLSPARDNVPNNTISSVAQRPPPPRKDSLKNPARQSLEEAAPPERPAPLSRASTTTVIPDTVESAVDQEGLLRAGKKVATEFQAGLWTFWEDLRHATVGEDIEVRQPPRRKSSTQTLRTARKQSSKSSLRDSSAGTGSTDTKRPPLNKKKSSGALPDLADPGFWSDHGIAMSQPAAKTVKKKTNTAKQSSPVEPTKRSSAVSNDAWDTWDDSPVQSRSSSSVTSETTTLPSTVSGSPRNSMSVNNRDSRDMSKKEAIPWPVLKKSGLGSLRRTASHLLSEWEKSLTPSPGQEYTGEDYMGASAEAAAFGATKGKND